MSVDRGQIIEFGSGTRRRLIRRGYAAANDAEVGIGAEDRRQKTDDRGQSSLD